MGSLWQSLINNRILLTGGAAWALSQVLKILIHLAVHREFVLERLFGDGGMPSSHSATVSSVAVKTGLLCGWDSPVFALAAILAIIVMHDAMGVRLETGKQAKAINEIIEHLISEEDMSFGPDQALTGGRRLSARNHRRAFCHVVLKIKIWLKCNLFKGTLIC